MAAFDILDRQLDNDRGLYSVGYLPAWITGSRYKSRGITCITRGRCRAPRAGDGSSGSGE